jgi:hypothetical protein
MQPIHVSSEKQAKNQGSELFIKAGKVVGFRSVHRNRQRHRVLSTPQKQAKNQVSELFIKADNKHWFQAVHRIRQR